MAGSFRGREARRLTHSHRCRRRKRLVPINELSASQFPGGDSAVLDKTPTTETRPDPTRSDPFPGRGRPVPRRHHTLSWMPTWTPVTGLDKELGVEPGTPISWSAPVGGCMINFTRVLLNRGLPGRIRMTALCGLHRRLGRRSEAAMV